jgi:hypothetical protein
VRSGVRLLIGFLLVLGISSSSLAPWWLLKGYTCSLNWRNCLTYLLIYGGYQKRHISTGTDSDRQIEIISRKAACLDIGLVDTYPAPAEARKPLIGMYIHMGIYMYLLTMPAGISVTCRLNNA